MTGDGAQETCPEELQLTARCPARHPHPQAHTAAGRLPNGCHFALVWWRVGPPPDEQR